MRKKNRDLSLELRKYVEYVRVPLNIFWMFRLECWYWLATKDIKMSGVQRSLKKFMYSIIVEIYTCKTLKTFAHLNLW